MGHPERPSWSDGLLELGLGSDRAADLLSWRSLIDRMLMIEATIAGAQARLGLIPDHAAERIARLCDPQRIDHDDVIATFRDAATPVIALLEALHNAARNGDADFLHYGVTSQDVLDTAMLLAIRDVLDALEAELNALGDTCALIADRHRSTVMAGRTLLQQAVPITFGLKAARWLGAIDRRLTQLREVRTRTAVIQLGGAVGTLGAVEARGLDLVVEVARMLRLGVPDQPWHAERDRIIELAGMLASITGVVAKISTDIILLAQTEVAEVREQSGPLPGSSSMPHKQNPMHAVRARAAARLASGEVSVLLSSVEHEHERAAGAWQAEWVALPGALIRTLGSVEALHRSLTGLNVDSERMQLNLEREGGLGASAHLAGLLAQAIGLPAAQSLLAELSARSAREGRPFAAVIADEPRVTELLDPAALLVAMQVDASSPTVNHMIDRALTVHAQPRTASVER